MHPLNPDVFVFSTIWHYLLYTCNMGPVYSERRQEGRTSTCMANGSSYLGMCTHLLVVLTVLGLALAVTLMYSQAVSGLQQPTRVVVEGGLRYIRKQGKSFKKVNLQKTLKGLTSSENDESGS
jgi:hypothetical protein